MNRREFQIGPGAASLLLIAVVLCMGVLGALSLVSARGDAQLSVRGATLAEEAAELNTRSEQRMAELDALLVEFSGAGSEEEYLERIAQSLPEDAAMDGRTVSWTEEMGGTRRLTCAVEIAPLGEFPRAYWTEHRFWTELDEEDPSEQLLFS